MKYENITKGKGDDGKTDLCLGGRVFKNDLRIEAVGDIDEFNASLGLCRSHLKDESFRGYLDAIQNTLTCIMGELSTSHENREKYLNKFNGLHKKDLARLDFMLESVAIALDQSDRDQNSWVVYGSKGEASARLDFAGTVCRRCERRIVGLTVEDIPVRAVILQYFNRLSKVLYLMARHSEM